MGGTPMEHLAKTTATSHTRWAGEALDEALDGYFGRLCSVACVTIVDELMRSLAEFYDAAAASDRLAEFRTHCQGHALHGLLLQDPFTARGFVKPRGQAADARDPDRRLRRRDDRPAGAHAAR